MTESGEPSIPSPTNDEGARREKLLAVLADGIITEDFDFVNGLVSHQTLLSPAELVEHMDTQRQQAEDPIVGWSWSEGLRLYLASITNRELPPEEAESVQRVRAELEAAQNRGNDGKVEETEVPASADNEEEADDWEKETFAIEVNKATIADVLHTTAFKNATRILEDQRFPIEDRLERAKSIIVKGADGPIRKYMLQVFDWYVFSLAEAIIVNTDKPKDYNKALERVEAIIGTYASIQTVEMNMFTAIDKHVYWMAVRIVNSMARDYHDFQQKMGQAQALIRRHGSTPERREAMLKRLSGNA